MGDDANLKDAKEWLLRGGELTPQQLGDRSFVEQVEALLKEASWVFPILGDRENWQAGLKELGIRTRKLATVVRACLEERVALCGEGSFEEALVVTACGTWEPPTADSQTPMPQELADNLEEIVRWVVERDGETDQDAFKKALEEFLARHDPRDWARQLLRASSGRSVLFDGSNKPVPELVALLGAAVRKAFAERPLTAMGKQRLVGLVMHLQPSPHDDRLFIDRDMESLGLNPAEVKRASNQVGREGDFSYIEAADSLGVDEDFPGGNDASDRILGLLGFEIDRAAVAFQRGLRKVHLPKSEDAWVRMTRESLHSAGAKFLVAFEGLKELATSQGEEFNAEELGVLEKEDMWRRADHFDLWWKGKSELASESDACVGEVSLALQDDLDSDAAGTMGPIGSLLGGLLSHWFTHGIDKAVRHSNEFGLGLEDLKLAHSDLREDASALAKMEMGVKHRTCIERVLDLGAAGLEEAGCPGADNIYSAARDHVLASVKLSPKDQWIIAPTMSLAFSNGRGSAGPLLDWIQENGLRAAFLDGNSDALSKADPLIQLELARVVLSSPEKSEDGFRWDDATSAEAVAVLTEALEEKIKGITDAVPEEAGIVSRLWEVKREILKCPLDTTPAAEALLRGDASYFKTELRRAGREERLKALANAGPPLAHRWSKQVKAAKVLLTVPTFVVGFFLWASLWLISVYWKGETRGGGEVLDGVVSGESEGGKETGATTPEAVGLLKVVQEDGAIIWVQAESVTPQAFADLQPNSTPPELSESLTAQVSYESARRYCEDYGRLLLGRHPELFGADKDEVVCRLPRLSELQGVKNRPEYRAGGNEWVASPKNPNLWDQEVNVSPEGQVAERSEGVSFRVVFEVE